MANYGTQAGAAELCDKVAADIKTGWLDQIDVLMEHHANQGWKGATRTAVRIGDGNSLLVLPSRAASVTSIEENGNLLDTSQYSFRGPTRLIERKNASFYQNPYGFMRRTGYWFPDSEYFVTYVEPTEAPADWTLTANLCGAYIAMFVDKYSEDGIALSASTNGQAAGHGSSVQSGGATSFPASLMEELKRIIKNGIRSNSVG